MAQSAVWISVPPYMKFHIMKTNTLSLEAFMSFYYLDTLHESNNWQTF
jgi:hypothetical protein